MNSPERNTKKPWLKQPGECYDSRGVPIYPGDLLRTYHFTGPRRKRYYLYHVAVFDTEAGAMRMVPVEWLEPSRPHDGGNPLLSTDLATNATIVYGKTIGDWVLFDERPKRRQL